MDFIFQTGEFINEESPFYTILGIVVSFLGILAGAVVSILVFKNGTDLERKKEEQRLSDLESYIKIGIEHLYNPINKQIEATKLFLRDLTATSEPNFAPEKIVSLHTKNIKWINPEDFHKIFIRNKGGSLIVKSGLVSNLNADFDYIDSVLPTLDETFKYFMAKFEKYEEEWNRNLRQMTEIKDRMQTEFELQRRQDPEAQYVFLSKLNALYNDWTRQKNFRQRHNSVEFFLSPLEDLCRKTEGDHFAFTMLTHATDCMYAQMNIYHLKRFINDTLIYMIRRLRKAERRIKYIVREFDKLQAAS